MGSRGVRWQITSQPSEQGQASQLIFYRKLFTYNKGVGVGEGGFSPLTDQPKAFSLKAVPVGRCLYKVFMWCGSLELQAWIPGSFE